MSPNENQGPPERHAPIPELLEHYKTQRVRLLAQTRELERLRDEVRGSAEREAAAIVTAARRNVRQVLLDARRELLVLAAQLQAVGCDTPADDRNVVQGEATSTPLVGPASSAPPAAGAPGDTRELVADARRDVREVLVEAQSELMALSEEAKALRARLAGRRDAGQDPAPEAPVFIPEGQPSAPEAAPPHYASLPSTSRVWVSIAAAVAFAAVGLAALLMPRDPEPAPPVARRSETAGPAATTGLVSAPAASPVAVSESPRDRSMVSLTMSVRRPAWIRMTVDGRPDIGRLYAPGETKTIGDAREIVMRVGDAGAVFVSLNGGEARALGGNGLVVTRRFAAREPAVREAAAGVPVRPDDGRPVLASRAPESAGTLQPPGPPLPAGGAARPDVGTTGETDPAPSASEAAARLIPPAPSATPAAERPIPPLPSSTPAAERLIPPLPSSTPAAEREIMRATQRWFEAFFGNDRAGMAEVATDDFALTDERTRQAAGGTDVDRSMQQVRIEVAGDGAVLSARLTERVTIDGQVRQYTSLVSGVWIRRDGRWRLMAVRFVDPETLGLQP